MIPPFEEVPIGSGVEVNTTSAVLLRLAKGASPSDVLVAIGWAHQAGTFRWDAPADKDGKTFLEAWSDQLPHHQTLPSEVLTAFEAWSDGQVWKHMPKSGDALLTQWLRTVVRTTFVEDKVDQALSMVIVNTPVEVINGWHDGLLLPANERYEKDPLGAPLLSYMMKISALNGVHALFDRGLTLMGMNPETERPIAAEIRHPSLWTALMNQGGDPETPITINNETIPLWQHLRQQEPAKHTYDLDHRNRIALKSLIDAWASVHCPEVLNKLETDEYWAALNDRSADGSTMKSRDDWPRLRDDQGRTPMMVLVGKDPKMIKEFWKVKKAANDVAAVDHEGNTLWFHTLGKKGSKAPSGTMAWLIEHVPLTMSHEGWGLVQQCYAGLSSRFENAVLNADEWPEKWLSKDEQHRWWGDTKAQDELANWMMKREFVGNLPPSFRELSVAAHRSSWQLSSALLGALVLNEMVVTKPLTETQWWADIDRWVEQGALTGTIPPATLTKLQSSQGRGSVVHERIQVLLGKLEANALRQGLEDTFVTPATTARRRL